MPMEEEHSLTELPSEAEMGIMSQWLYLLIMGIQKLWHEQGWGYRVTRDQAEPSMLFNYTHNHCLRSKLWILTLDKLQLRTKCAADLSRVCSVNFLYSLTPEFYSTTVQVNLDSLNFKETCAVDTIANLRYVAQALVHNPCSVLAHCHGTVIF